MGYENNSGLTHREFRELGILSTLKNSSQGNPGRSSGRPSIRRNEGKKSKGRNPLFVEKRRVCFSIL